MGQDSRHPLCFVDKPWAARHFSKVAASWWQAPHQEVPPVVPPISFDIQGAARFLSATLWAAIRRAIYAGKLSYKRFGKRIIIRRAVLEEFVSTGLKREGTGRR